MNEFAQDDEQEGRLVLVDLGRALETEPAAEEEAAPGTEVSAEEAATAATANDPEEPAATAGEAKTLEELHGDIEAALFTAQNLSTSVELASGPAKSVLTATLQNALDLTKTALEQEQQSA